MLEKYFKVYVVQIRTKYLSWDFFKSHTTKMWLHEYPIVCSVWLVSLGIERRARIGGSTAENNSHIFVIKWKFHFQNSMHLNISNRMKDEDNSKYSSFNVSWYNFTTFRNQVFIRTSMAYDFLPNSLTQPMYLLIYCSCFQQSKMKISYSSEW